MSKLLSKGVDYTIRITERNRKLREVFVEYIIKKLLDRGYEKTDVMTSVFGDKNIGDCTVISKDEIIHLYLDVNGGCGSSEDAYKSCKVSYCVPTRRKYIPPKLNKIFVSTRYEIKNPYWEYQEDANLLELDETVEKIDKKASELSKLIKENFNLLIISTS